MTEVLKHYSKCNRIINAEMIRVLENAKGDPYSAEVDGYFKSIGEIIDHIYKADVMWLMSFKTIRDYSIFGDPVFAVMPDWNVRIFNDLASCKKSRIHLDDVFARLTDEIEESDFPKNVSRVTRSGEKQEKLFWKALIHVFNHQTHHRGQVSQILDQLKIENDYSNMIRID